MVQWGHTAPALCTEQHWLARLSPGIHWYGLGGAAHTHGPFHNKSCAWTVSIITAGLGSRQTNVADTQGIHSPTQGSYQQPGTNKFTSNRQLSRCIRRCDKTRASKRSVFQPAIEPDIGEIHGPTNGMDPHNAPDIWSQLFTATTNDYTTASHNGLLYQQKNTKAWGTPLGQRQLEQKTTPAPK